MPLKSRQQYEAELQEARQSRLDYLLSLGSAAIEADRSSFSVVYTRPNSPINSWEQLKEVLPNAVNNFAASGWTLAIQSKEGDKCDFVVRFNG